MIKKECFTAEWIEQVSSELHYNDKNLIEKVIRALSLLEMLVKAGCPLVFKGGTALMLILGKSAHRLSIDIDLICPPGTNIEDYLKSFADFGFINLELVERKQRDDADIPKSHSKFFYQIAYRNDTDAQSYILLDVLYEDIHYFRIRKEKWRHQKRATIRRSFRISAGIRISPYSGRVGRAVKNSRTLSAAKRSVRARSGSSPSAKRSHRRRRSRSASDP